MSDDLAYAIWRIWNCWSPVIVALREQGVMLPEEEPRFTVAFNRAYQQTERYLANANIANPYTHWQTHGRGGAP